MAESDFLPVEDNFAERWDGAGAKETFQEFGPACAHQTGDAENLAAAECEVDLGQPPFLCMAGAGE